MPDVEEFTEKPSGTPDFTDSRKRRWGTFRGATLQNYDNEADELLPDHKRWLETDLVPTLRDGRALGLGCRLVGSASNDNAGVKHNLQVAERRAKKAKAFLLGRGVPAEQIFLVQSKLDTSTHSTLAKDRHVTAFLLRPINGIFGIRKVVLAASTSLLPWGAVHFFEIRDRQHGLSAFYAHSRFRPPNAPMPQFALLTRPGAFDSPVTLPKLVSLQDFDGADMEVSMLPVEPDGPNQGGVTLGPRGLIVQPGQFASEFPMPLFTPGPFDPWPKPIQGRKLFLVRGPEKPTLP